MDTVYQMPKWLSLRHLELKCKFIPQFEFLEYLLRPCSPTTFSLQTIYGHYAPKI